MHQCYEWSVMFLHPDGAYLPFVVFPRPSNTLMFFKKNNPIKGCSTWPHCLFGEEKGNRQSSLTGFWVIVCDWVCEAAPSRTAPRNQDAQMYFPVFNQGFIEVWGVSLRSLFPSFFWIFFIFGSSLESTPLLQSHNGSWLFYNITMVTFTYPWDDT